MDNSPTLLNFSAYKTSLDWRDYLAKAVGKPWTGNKFLGFAISLIGLLAAIYGLARAFTGPTYPLNDFLTGLFIFFFLILAPLSSLFKRFSYGLSRSKQAERLHLFALDNNFIYYPELPTTGFYGILFDKEGQQSLQTVLEGSYQNLPFSIGNLMVTVGNDDKQKIEIFGFIRVSLSRYLPHVLLDSKANNLWRKGNLAASLRNSQSLQLEGDFNRYFDVYVPHNYERDALYFLTPELMTLLIDHGNNYDIEVKDNNLYIYNNEQFSLDEKQTMETIFSLMANIASEFEDNTRRYADANVGHRDLNVVAAPGRELKRKIVWTPIIGIMLFILFAIVAATN